MYKGFLIGLLALVSGALVSAKVVSLPQAEQFVTDRFGTQGSLVWTVTAESDPADPLLYVFSLGEDRGFCLVAAEDQLPPLLGYTTKGDFDQSDLSVGLHGLLAAYGQEIQQVRTAGDGVTDNGWQVAIPVEERLLDTACWGQGYPYNKDTPTVGGQTTRTGSLSTATGIVLQYYGFPQTQLMGCTSYRGKSVPWGGFDWRSMPKVEPVEPLAVDQVGRLLWVLGAYAGVDYGVNETEGSLYRMWQVLRSELEFGECNHYVRSVDWAFADWLELIRADIQASCPVLYEGGAMLARQTVVCDGYTADGLVHINWGESGLNNGFYRLSLSDAAWPGDQAMIIGLQPAWPWLDLIDLHAGVVDSHPVQDLTGAGLEPLSVVSTDNGGVTVAVNQRERAVITDASGRIWYDQFLEVGQHTIPLKGNMYSFYYGAHHYWISIE